MDTVSTLEKFQQQGSAQIHPVILSGGAGTRLWPLSRASYPKQLLKLSSQRTMLQDTVARGLADVGFAAPHLVCNDDHRFGPSFADAVRAVADEPWDVLVPNRFTERDTARIPLNNGERAGYCGGHAGVFRRELIARLPWSAGPHDRLWDLHMSCVQRAMGARFVWSPRADIAVEDIEHYVNPDAAPWT